MRRFYHATHCCYCRRKFTPKKVRKSIDHRVPVHKGGAHDDHRNLMICCRDCNRSKAWLGVSAWIALCKRVAETFSAPRAKTHLTWLTKD